MVAADGRRVTPHLRIAAATLATLAATSGSAKDWCTVTPARARAALATSGAAIPAEAVAHPIARVHVEGTLPHQGIYDESFAALADLPVMLDAALVWRAGGGRAHRDAAQRMLLAWIDTYRPSLNPIDETGFDALIETFAVLREQMSPANRGRVIAWLTRWVDGYVAAIAAPHTSRDVWVNNWQSHRVKLITLIAAATQNPELFATARRLFREQVAANLRGDGTTRDFHSRDALHYVVYGLEPLVRTAIVARATSGEDWFRWQAPSGASLQRSLRWLLPYAQGKLVHQEFVRSTVAFDAERAAAGVPGFSGPWNPKTAAMLFWTASSLDPRYRPVAAALSRPPAFVTLCGG